ncbi:MAG: ATP-binding protein [Spirochaetia bacterium]|jgi:predicted AAA+ superfamily ATPase|nr:ATP-binding protein [Spirochaetia bacterium]
MIQRILEGKITDRIASFVPGREGNHRKAIIIVGARQTGKTSLLHMKYPENDARVLWLNGDELDVQRLFEDITADRLRRYLGKKDILIIDEAQRIRDVGLRLKLITDNMKDIQLIATGSSSFDLANKVNEPLTGRKQTYQLFPLSFEELVNDHGLLEEKRMIPERLVFGSYPEVVTSPGQEKTILRELTDSYLYKDILSLDGIQKPEKLTKLLQALALQVGAQVSFNELAQLCSMDPKTVERYITVLEQAYIIFRLSSFSRNARNELKNSRKVYFYDNGVRNAIIANFSSVELRTDIGALWENYLVSERMKYLGYTDRWVHSWFWRTKTRQGIDLVEEEEGTLRSYEFKWSTHKRARQPTSFSNAYPDVAFAVITPDNVEDFLLP